jgi:hypothetical protein
VAGTHLGGGAVATKRLLRLQPKLHRGPQLGSRPGVTTREPLRHDTSGRWRSLQADLQRGPQGGRRKRGSCEWRQRRHRCEGRKGTRPVMKRSGGAGLVWRGGAAMRRCGSWRGGVAVVGRAHHVQVIVVVRLARCGMDACTTHAGHRGSVGRARATEAHRRSIGRGAGPGCVVGGVPRESSVGRGTEDDVAVAAVSALLRSRHDAALPPLAVFQLPRPRIGMVQTAPPQAWRADRHRHVAPPGGTDGRRGCRHRCASQPLEGVVMGGLGADAACRGRSNT